MPYPAVLNLCQQVFQQIQKVQLLLQFQLPPPWRAQQISPPCSVQILQAQYQRTLQTTRKEILTCLRFSDLFRMRNSHRRRSVQGESLFSCHSSQLRMIFSIMWIPSRSIRRGSLSPDISRSRFCERLMLEGWVATSLEEGHTLHWISVSSLG